MSGVLKNPMWRLDNVDSWSHVDYIADMTIRNFYGAFKMPYMLSSLAVGVGGANGAAFIRVG